MKNLQNIANSAKYLVDLPGICKHALSLSPKRKHVERVMALLSGRQNPPGLDTELSQASNDAAASLANLCKTLKEEPKESRCGKN